MFKMKKRESFLGIATGTRQYDLPLNKDKGNNFLILLMALMSLMGVLALTGSFALSEMKKRWTSGLENKATVEIPAQDSNGILLNKETIDDIAAKAVAFLEAEENVITTERLSDDEISSLISPWLGNNESALAQFPLPVLVTVTFHKNAETDLIAEGLQNISPIIKLDQHESWLSDVLTFTGALKATAIAVTLIVLLATLVSVAGAVQARMAVYKEELELLHIMGAADRYITRQIQRYMFFITLRGAAAGTLIGIIIVLIGTWLTSQSGPSLLPDFSLSGFQWIALLFLPFFIAFIGMGTARYTTLRTLRKMT